jgi:hypothetical protein
VLGSFPWAGIVVVLASDVRCFGTANDYPVASLDISQVSVQILRLRTIVQILIGLSLLATIAVGCASGNSVSPSDTALQVTPSAVTPTDNLKRVVGITKDVVQIVAIVTAAGWASYRLGLFRDRIPRGVISHEVTHRPLTDNTIHLSVAIIFSNAGHVLWSFDPTEQNITTIQQLKPISPDQLTDIEQQFEERTGLSYGWPKIDDRSLTFRLEVEPSDAEHIHYEFIIDNTIESILIYSYYSRDDRGWDVTTIYDIPGT